jgi:hypothetical protein
MGYLFGQGLKVFICLVKKIFLYLFGQGLKVFICLVKKILFSVLEFGTMELQPLSS